MDSRFRWSHVTSRSLVTVMWFVAFLSIFGLETREWVRPHTFYVPILLAAAFAIVTDRVRAFLLHRTEQRHALTRTSLTLQAYVERRAHKLGIGDIEVRLIRRSPEAVDAFAYSRGARHVIAITGGAQVAFESSPEQCKLLIDHELGHLASNDTELLYLAKAIVATSILLLPAKFVLMFMAPRSLYRDLLIPEGSHMVPFGGTSGGAANWVLIRDAHSDFVGIVAAIVYTLLMIGLLMVLYVVFVRKRELWADLFALRTSESPETAIAALETLLRGESMPSLPEQSFLGSGLWHPPIDKRIEHAFSSLDRPRSLHALFAIVSALLLVAFRMTLGHVSAFSESTQPSPLLIPISLLYAWLVSYSVCSLMLYSQSDPFGQSYLRERLLPQLRGAAVLFAYWAGVAVVLVCCDTLVRSRQGIPYAVKATGYAFLLDIETFETRLAILSFPVVGLVFGIAYVVWDMVCSLYPHHQEQSHARAIVNRALPVLILGALLLALVTKHVRHEFLEYRAQKFDAFVQKQCKIYWDPVGDPVLRAMEPPRPPEDLPVTPPRHRNRDLQSRYDVRARSVLGGHNTRQAKTAPTSQDGSASVRSAPPAFEPANSALEMSQLLASVLEFYDPRNNPDVRHMWEAHVARELSAAEQDAVSSELELYSFVPPFDVLNLSRAPFRLRGVSKRVGPFLEQVGKPRSIKRSSARCLQVVRDP